MFPDPLKESSKHCVYDQIWNGNTTHTTI